LGRGGDPLSPLEKWTREKKRERGKERQKKRQRKKDREKKDRQTDRAFPDMPDFRFFSTEYDRWHKKWQLEKFNYTTHADKIRLIIK
jgi:hypothetical protein